MKTVVECPEGGTVTVECGCTGTVTQPDSPKQKKTSKKRRHISDELIKKWVHRYRTYHTPFSYMAEEDGFSLPTVALNIYKHCTFESEESIKTLKAELVNSRALATALQGKVEELEASGTYDPYGECPKIMAKNVALAAQVEELQRVVASLQDENADLHESLAESNYGGYGGPCCEELEALGETNANLRVELTHIRRRLGQCLSDA